MKKFLVVVLAFAVAIGLVAAMGCSSTATGPTSAEKTQTAVVNANATATAVVNAVIAAEKYNFNTDQTASWAASGVLSAKTWNSTAGADHYGNAGCMQLTGDYSSAGMGALQASFAATDFSGKTISAWINTPASMVDATHPYGVQFYVQDSTYGWDASWVNITGSGWQHYTWVLPATLGQDIHNILQVGFQITGGTGSASAGAAETVIIDDIDW
jgi:hypothetical protein